MQIMCHDISEILLYVGLSTAQSSNTSYFDNENSGFKVSVFSTSKNV